MLIYPSQVINVTFRQAGGFHYQVLLAVAYPFIRGEASEPLPRAGKCNCEGCFGAGTVDKFVYLDADQFKKVKAFLAYVSGLPAEDIAQFHRQQLLNQTERKHGRG